MGLETQVRPKVLPFCNSIAVIESPVDEEQRASGIIVPLQAGEEGHHQIKRGVITAIGISPCEQWAELRVGMIVYYVHGARVLDQYLVAHDEILAYEEMS